MTTQSDTAALPSQEFFGNFSLTPEQGGRNSDTFLTGMHLAVITGDQFCVDLAHLKQA